VFWFAVGFLLCWFIGCLFLCLTCFLWGQGQRLSAGSLLSACYDGCWLFFSFAGSFDFGSSSLALEMRLVDSYLPYFRQQLITHLLSALLPIQSLFTESYCGDQFLTSPPFSSVLTAPRSLCCSFLVPCLLFTFCFVLWGRGGCHSVQGAMLVYPKDGCGNTTWCLFAHLLICQMSPKQVWSRSLAVQEPSCFLSVTWHGEALYGLRVQGVKVFILLCAFFLPSVAPGFQQDFWFMEFMLSASAL
jgi:hypothetical protein